ncbi:MAG: HAMP domain-containing protein [Pseudomonadota bacterium]|nr:HAMP domain-containing protein [Pseudomonadota bacterium]
MNLPRLMWPRTLAAQLIVLTAAAVLLSNVGVAVWFAATHNRLTESDITERLLDRASAVASLLGGIPAKERQAAVQAMSSEAWHFRLLHGKAKQDNMTSDEAALAARLRAMLPEKRAKEPIDVHIMGPGDYRAPLPRDHLLREHGSITEIILPVVRGTQLETTVFRLGPPPWALGQFLLTALVAILTASAAAAFAVRRVARPLQRLANAASEVAHGGRAPLLKEDGPDDVRRAAHAFNAMTDQVTRTLESQRQLLSAVGHDLRTPITAMRISMEFIEDEELRERLQKNLLELQSLTEAVLDAARGAGWEERRKIDLAALIESLCADLEDLEMPVTWVPHDAAPVVCRPNEIRRAVRNLIENAVAYGTSAAVRLEETDGSYSITVEDNGPGIAEADRVRVFAPFVRLEGSRSSETGGAGLGLTLVKAIAENHGGSITLENRAEGGLKAILHLPREAAGA